jgi:hypothetical protein
MKARPETRGTGGPRRRRARARGRILALLGLAVFLGALGAVVIRSVGAVTEETRAVAPPASKRPAERDRREDRAARLRPGRPTPRAGRERRARRAASAPLVRLVGVAAYDPDGDGREYDELARAATDGDPATYWKTEQYRSFGWKSGVGLVLDAGRRVKLRRLSLSTDTPGFTAEIRAGDAARGPFRVVSTPTVVESSTTFELDGDTAARYTLIWLTSLGDNTGEVGGVAHVNEVRAR